MQLNAINSLNFKSSSPINYDEIRQDHRRKLEEVEEIPQFIESSNIKGPFATAAAVGGIALKSSIGGGATAIAIDKIAGNRISEGLITTAKHISKAMTSASAKLTQNGNKKIIKQAGEVLGKTQNTLKNAFVKIATDKSGSNLSGSKALVAIGGTVAAITGLASICSKDTNNNGVKDITEKWWNAYTGQATTQADMVDGFAKAAAVMQEVFA